MMALGLQILRLRPRNYHRQIRLYKSHFLGTFKKGRILAWMTLGTCQSFVGKKEVTWMTLGTSHFLGKK